MSDPEYRPPHAVDSTSTRLLARVRRQEPEAWRQLVELYGPIVRYWIRRGGVKGADLADVFQDVFLAVARNIAEFERHAGKAKFRAWLKTVTHSKVQDHFRRQQMQPQTFGGSTNQLRFGEVPADPDATALTDGDDPALAHPEDAFIAQRTLHMVKSEFRDGTWQALQLTAIEGLTSQEAAARLGLTPLAVRKAKSRVLQRLKAVLGQAEGDRP
jgi:RNA polymerase sigma-70 factor (ECF subfamily)